MSTHSDPFRDGCALLDLDATSGVLRARGADAADYLQRQVSADLTQVSSECGVLSTLMTRKGKMIAVGTKDEIRNSGHPRIRQFLDRVADEAGEDQGAYLERLTER